MGAAKNQPDFDDVDTESIKRKGNSWDEFKEKLYYKTAVDQYFDRGERNFKDY